MPPESIIPIDLILLLGRLLVAALFLQSGLTKPFAWHAALDEIESFGLPRSSAVLAPVVAAQFVGGLGVALGLLNNVCALGLLAFMIPATLHIHGWWRYQGRQREHHFAGFFQNLTMSGGLVLLLATGPGSWSLDAAIASAAR